MTSITHSETPHATATTTAASAKNASRGLGVLPIVVPGHG